MNNKNALVEDSSTFYETLGKYKFVLVLESSVCQEFIGRRLWQALHVGAVPVYFGADAINIWMPNQPSLVNVREFKNPKLLADHLTMLHMYKDRYTAYLQHKPTYNDNYFTLISNKELSTAVLNAKYLEQFECMVCERVAKNEKIIKLGFKGYPYHSPETKLSCPPPSSILTHLGIKPRKESAAFNRKWTRSKYESEALRKFDLRGQNFSQAGLESEILRSGREDKRPMDQYLN